MKKREKPLKKRTEYAKMQLDNPVFSARIVKRILGGYDMKFPRVLAAMPAAATMILCGSGRAFAATANPLTANESPVTGWVFAGIIGTAAVAGVLYFIFSGKKK